MEEKQLPDSVVPIYDNDTFYSVASIKEMSPNMIGVKESHQPYVCEILRGAHQSMIKMLPKIPCVDDDTKIHGAALNSVVTMMYLVMRCGMRSLHTNNICRNMLVYHNPSTMYFAMSENFTSHDVYNIADTWDTVSLWHRRFVLVVLVLAGRDYDKSAAYVRDNITKDNWKELVKHSTFYINIKTSQSPKAEHRNKHATPLSKVGVHVFGTYGERLLSTHPRTASKISDVIFGTVSIRGNKLDEEKTLHRLCSIDPQGAFDILAALTHPDYSHIVSQNSLDMLNTMMDTYESLTAHLGRS